MELCLSANTLGSDVYALGFIVTSNGKCISQDLLAIHPSKCQGWSIDEMAETMANGWPASTTHTYLEAGDRYSFNLELVKLLEPYAKCTWVSDVRLGFLKRLVHEGLCAPHIYDFKSLMWKQSYNRNMLPTESPLSPLGRAQYISRILNQHVF